MSTASKDVAKVAPLDDNQLRDMQSYESVMQILAKAGIKPKSISEYGTGFEVANQKDLVNVPFVIVDARIVPAEKSDYGKDFLVFFAFTNTNRKLIINDGSTGLCEQAKGIGVENLIGTVHEKGLTVSEYDHIAPDGTRTPARTYYFAGI